MWNVVDICLLGLVCCWIVWPGWPLLPGIVAQLAQWRLRTWPDIDIHMALLFVATTKEAGDASARVVATLCNLETWLPRPDAAGQPLFGLTPMLSDLSVGHRGCARGAGGHIGYKDINDELLHYPQLRCPPLFEGLDWVKEQSIV